MLKLLYLDTGNHIYIYTYSQTINSSTAIIIRNFIHQRNYLRPTPYLCKSWFLVLQGILVLGVIFGSGEGEDYRRI